MAELALSRLIQVESEGQQKSSGSFVLLQLVYEVGQESELLGRRSREPNAWPGPILARRVKSSSMDGRTLIPGVDLAILWVRM